MTPVAPVTKKMGAQALYISAKGAECCDIAETLTKRHDYRGAYQLLSDFLEQECGPFFAQDLPANPLVLGAGEILVRVSLMRIFSMLQWGQSDASVRGQLEPLMRTYIQWMTEWPEDFFPEDLLSAFAGLRRMFGI